MKQTAVEWLMEQYYASYKIEESEFNQALAMEKDQIIYSCIEATSWGKDSSHSESSLKAVTEWSEDYYNQTYGKEETK
jgi:hypothetical protein